MHKSPLSFGQTECSVRTADLPIYRVEWLDVGKDEGHSDETKKLRDFLLNKLQWFLEREGSVSCGVHELRAFFRYIRQGHEHPGGRWGNPLLTKPVKQGTIATYNRHLRAFFAWLIEEEVLAGSPMERIKEPIDRPDQIEPFTGEQIDALLAAARKSVYPKRDEAIVWLLLDTGLRASELCALKIEDVDMTARRCKIQEGKGGKSRSVWMGRTCHKALWTYLHLEPHEAQDPLFFNKLGESLTRSGLLQLMERLGEAASIQQTRCSPHTFRHTFAVSFLRAGGDLLTLQQLLGHSSLAMVNRYVKFAQADLQQRHRQYSPGDRHKNRNRATT